MWWLETGILGENPKNYFLTYFGIFEEKKLFCHFWQKITFFADFDSRFSDFISKTVLLQLQQCREQLNLSLLQLMAFLRQPLPQLQLQQGQYHNLYLLQLQLQRLLKPLSATGTNFAASDLVAVAVRAKKDI